MSEAPCKALAIEALVRSRREQLGLTPVDLVRRWRQTAFPPARTVSRG